MIITSIDDLRRAARARLPRAVFDFIDGGAGDEVTLEANRSDFARLRLLPRALVDVSHLDHSTTVLGQRQDLPLILAPTGLPALISPGGAMDAARAAQAAGAGFCLSTMATSSIEQIAEAIRTPWWFQLYVMKDRELCASMVRRAKAAGCQALVITVDLATQGSRERDVRNGFTIPPRLRASNLLDFALHYRWTLRFLASPRIALANFSDAGSKGKDFFTIAAFVNSQFDQSVTWKDVRWAADLFGGPVLLKGVLNPLDARLAMDNGVAGVIVSNHGGRQLDGVPSAIAALPGVVDAVAGRGDVILDGGVRRGSDVIKAFALGANACMIGRPFLYGLASGGEAGVARALSILRNEIDVALTLLGRASLRDIDRDALYPA